MLLGLIAFTSFVSVVSVKKLKATQRKVNEKNKELQLVSDYLHVYINEERNYEAIKSELAVKSHFYQQAPMTARGAYTKEVLQLQSALQAQKAIYLEAKKNYLGSGKYLV
ncbi:hypothetical protein VcTj87_07550 [Vibrio comitans]